MKRIFLIATALLSIAYGTTASAVTAVAFSPISGRYGVAWNEPDKETALRKAKEDCLHRGGAKDCKQLRVTEEKGFGAVAQTCAGEFCGISVITGRRSAKQAEADAVSDCNSYYGAQDCRVYDNWEERGAVAVAPKPVQAPEKPVEPKKITGEMQKKTKSVYSKKTGRTLIVEYIHHTIIDEMPYAKWQTFYESNDLLIDSYYSENNGKYIIWDIYNMRGEKELKIANYEYRSVAIKTEIDCSIWGEREVKRVYYKNYRRPGDAGRSDDIRYVTKFDDARWKTGEEGSSVYRMLLCKGGGD